MSGYIKLLKTECEQVNADWFQRSQALGEGALSTRYTNFTEDANPLYCWGQVGPLLTDSFSPEESALIRTYSQADAEGMIVIKTVNYD